MSNSGSKRFELLLAIVATAGILGGCASSDERPFAKSTDPSTFRVPNGDGHDTPPPAVATTSFNELAEIDPSDDLVSPSDRISSASDVTIAGLLQAEQIGPAANASPEIELLGLAKLESLAESNHPDLRRAQAAISQARGTASQAALPYNPVFQYRSDEIGNGGFSGLHTVTLSQRMVTANKLGIAQQQQLQVVQQRAAEYELARLRVLTRVRSAFAETVVAQERESITRSIAGLAQRSADTVKTLLDAEEVSRIAYLQAEVEAERAAMVARNAENRLTQKRRMLAAAVGISDLPSDRVQSLLPSDLPMQPWQSLAETVVAISPQVSAADAQLQRARWALNLACAQITPDITGQVGLGYDAATNDTYASVGVSVPLPIRNRNQGNIRAARASIGAAAAEIDQTELSLRSRLADTVGRYEVARQTYLQLRRKISPGAKEAFELAQTAFESGEADYLQVLTAQRTWFDTRLDAINALESAQKADAEIQGLLTFATD